MEVLFEPGERILLTLWVTTRERLQTHDLALPQMLHNLTMNSVASYPIPDLAKLDSRQGRSMRSSHLLGRGSRENRWTRLEPRNNPVPIPDPLASFRAETHPR